VLALRPPLDWRELAIGRTAALYYPHVVWGLVYYFIAVVFARYYNSPIVDPGNVGLHMLEILTGEKSWFLPTLLVTTLVLWPLLRIAPYGTAFGTLGLALLGWFVATGWQVPSYLMRLAVFFAVGYVIASWLVERGEISRTVAGAGALALLALLLPMASLTFEGLSGWFLKVMASAIGVTGMWLAAVALRRVTWIAWLGKASLAIFVLHPMATGFARAALLKVVPDWPAGAYAVLVTLAGICLPALAYWLALKLQLNWLFIMPIKPAHLSRSA